MFNVREEDEAENGELRLASDSSKASVQLIQFFKDILD